MTSGSLTHGTHLYALPFSNLIESVANLNNIFLFVTIYLSIGESEAKMGRYSIRKLADIILLIEIKLNNE